MKNHFKRLLSLVLFVIMLVPMVSATGLTVSAATYSGTCGDNLTWSLDTATGVLKIDGTGDMTDYKYKNSKPYTTAPWGSYYSYIKSVVISDSVTSIGDYAFRNCTSLTSVTIGNSVTSIGDRAFYSCTSLTSVTVDANNQYYASFDGVLYNKDLTDLIQYPIGNSRPTFIIPDFVTSIGEWAFYECTSLISVTIGNSVTSIGGSAFAYCSLTSVTIPDSVTSIGESAFYECTSLTSVYITDIAAWCGIDFGSFSANPLYYAENLYLDNELVTNLVIPDTVTDINSYAFSARRAITSVTIGNSVTSIGDSAFDYCASLTSVTIGNSVTSIGDWAFYSCRSLTSVTIPDSVTSIGDYAFRGCTSLTSVTIGNSVTSIGYDAFDSCTSLTSVTIGNSVTSIGDSAFRFCTSLTSVTIPDSVTSIGSYAFYNTAYYNNSSNWTNKVLYIGNHLIVAKDSISGAFTIKDGTLCIAERAFYSCDSLTSVTIPDSVTSIGKWAFADCDALTSVTIGSSVTSISVTSIGYDAFDSCTSLTSVTIGNSVTSIGDWAFNKCTSLTSVTIPDSVTSIGDAAFKYCTSLTSVTIPDSVTSIGWDAFYNTAYYNNSSNWTNNVLYIGNHLIEAKNSISGAYSIKDGTLTIAGCAFDSCDSLTSVTIPDSVTSIGSYAFRDCDSLTSVTIPDSVTRIGSGAFQSCYSLTSVYITDIAAWCGIDFGSSDANPLCYTENLYLDNELITDLVIPDSVTSIGDWAFYSCDSLTSVTIPDSVTSIGDKAFHYYSDKLDLTIRCYENSYAHTYAVNNDFKYELMHKCVFTNYVSDNNATCTGDGTKTAYCDLGCGKTDTITDEGTALGHSFTEYVDYEAATCTDATRISRCDNGCGATDIIPVEGTALGHTWSEWIVSIEPTYTTEGEQIRFCYVCDIVENKIIPAVTNPEEDVLDRFEDVNKNAWYADAVRYCVTMGYAQGMNATTFAPNATLTRAQFVQLLAGIDGVDLTQYNETDSTFADVKVGAWFHNAITWAVRNEYVAGMSADSFMPNANLTRQQLVRILYNYAADNGVDVTGRADLTVYDDCDKIAEWAYEELSWAVYNKIVSGMTETTVGPRGTATRAQAMQIIKQFDSLESN